MNANYTKNHLIEYAYNEFIYCYQGEKRDKLLQDLTNNYPFNPKKNMPVTIYINDLSLPVVDNENIDSDMLSLMVGNYVNFTIVEKILEKMKESLSKINEADLDYFLSRVAKNYLSSKNVEQGFMEFYEDIKHCRDFYYQSYIAYCNLQIKQIDFRKIPYQGIKLDYFLHYLKQSFNMEKHFILLIDKNEKCSPYLAMTINELLYSSLDDLVIKVFLEPDIWETYYSLSGKMIQMPHDYTTFEFDNSFKNYLSNLRNKNNPRNKTKLDLAYERRVKSIEHFLASRLLDSLDSYEIYALDKNPNPSYILVIRKNDVITKMLKVGTDVVNKVPTVFIKGIIFDDSRDLKITVDRKDLLYKAISNLGKSIGHDKKLISAFTKTSSGSLVTDYDANRAMIALIPENKRQNKKYLEYMEYDYPNNIYATAIINFYCSLKSLASSSLVDEDTLRLIRENNLA